MFPRIYFAELKEGYEIRKVSYELLVTPDDCIIRVQGGCVDRRLLSTSDCYGGLRKIKTMMRLTPGGQSETVSLLVAIDTMELKGVLESLCTSYEQHYTLFWRVSFLFDCPVAESKEVDHILKDAREPMGDTAKQGGDTAGKGDCKVGLTLYNSRDLAVQCLFEALDLESYVVQSVWISYHLSEKRRGSFPRLYTLIPWWTCYFVSCLFAECAQEHGACSDQLSLEFRAGQGDPPDTGPRLLPRVTLGLSEALESFRTSYHLYGERERSCLSNREFWLLRTYSARHAYTILFAECTPDELFTKNLTLGGPAGQGDPGDAVRRLLTRVTEAFFEHDKSPDIVAVTSEASRRILTGALQLAIASNLCGARLKHGALCEDTRRLSVTLAGQLREAASVGLCNFVRPDNCPPLLVYYRNKVERAAGLEGQEETIASTFRENLLHLDCSLFVDFSYCLDTVWAAETVGQDEPAGYRYSDYCLSGLSTKLIAVERAAEPVGQDEAARFAERPSRQLEDLLIVMVDTPGFFDGAVQGLVDHQGESPCSKPVSVEPGGGTASQEDASVAPQSLVRGHSPFWMEGQTVLRRYDPTIGQTGDAVGQTGDAAGPGGDATVQAGDAEGPGGDATVQAGDAAAPGGDATVQAGDAAAPGNKSEAFHLLLMSLMTDQLPLLAGSGVEKQKNPKPTPCDHECPGFMKSVWKGRTEFPVLAAAVSLLVIAGLIACVVVLWHNQRTEQQIQIKGVQSSAAETGKDRAVLPPCGHGWIWYRNKCYYFSEVNGSWAEAKDSCAALDSSLATIDAQKELNFMLRYKGKENHWIGLKRDDKSQLWTWVNGIKFNNWFTISDASECASLTYDTVKSLECDITSKWICSKLAINRI